MDTRLPIERLVTQQDEELTALHAAAMEKFMQDPRIAGSTILSQEAASVMAWCEIIQTALTAPIRALLP